jgi:hypothetical protein
VIQLTKEFRLNPELMIGQSEVQLDAAPQAAKNTSSSSPIMKSPAKSPMDLEFELNQSNTGDIKVSNNLVGSNAADVSSPACSQTSLAIATPPSPPTTTLRENATSQRVHDEFEEARTRHRIKHVARAQQESARRKKKSARSRTNLKRPQETLVAPVPTTQVHTVALLPPAEIPAVQTHGRCRKLYSQLRRRLSRKVAPAIAPVTVPLSSPVLLTIAEETKQTKSASTPASSSFHWGHRP